jgi:hypothetical protein
MKKTLPQLLRKFDCPEFAAAGVIPWGSPIPVFGRLRQARLATLGINPSNREFVDAHGVELDGKDRRFHTLQSLSINRWSQAGRSDIDAILASCERYFEHNPYDGWFKALDSLISGTKKSYYDPLNSACHLDLVPFATSSKWTAIRAPQKAYLLENTGAVLGHLLKNSPIEVLVVNGRTVLTTLARISDINFQEDIQSGWTLQRKRGPHVIGRSYKGIVKSIGGVPLKRGILVLGFNHNIQSSFGVTTDAKSAIRNWLSKEARKVVK